MPRSVLPCFRPAGDTQVWLRHPDAMSAMRPAAFWRPSLAAAAATCSGIGLARFAYVPLFPAMVAAEWVDGGEAGVLGAANLAGYLAGALFGRWLGARIGTARTLNAGMALVASCFALCALPFGLWWLLLWRSLAGLAGGILMAWAGPAAQASVPAEKRGLAGGVVICGVAGGVTIASLLVPLLIPEGIAAAWLGLSGVVTGLWILARPNWPDVPVGSVTGQSMPLPPHRRLLLTYGLSGAAMVAPMVYLADLAVRGRGLDLTLASGVWLTFGLGGVLGTLTGGALVDRFGAAPCFRAWLLVQAIGLGLTLLPWRATLPLAAIVCGSAAIGITAVLLGLVRERAGPASGALWGRTTAAYGIAQACTAFPLAALFAATGETHAAVFGVGLALSVLALVLGLLDR